MAIPTPALIASAAIGGTGSLLNALRGSSSGSYGYNQGQGSSYNSSQSLARNNAEYANAIAKQNSAQAYERQKELLQMQMDYNSKEAQKARDWETQMANTVYTRSVANMKEAGINPILAANMGLSGASVGSGATASISGANAPMSQTFNPYEANSSSMGASQDSSYGENSSSSRESLAEGLRQLGEYLGNALSATQSAQNINITIENMEKIAKDMNPAAKEMLDDGYKDSGKDKGPVWDSLTKSIFGNYQTRGGYNLGMH